MFLRSNLVWLVAVVIAAALMTSIPRSPREEDTMGFSFSAEDYGRDGWSTRVDARGHVYLNVFQDMHDLPRADVSPANMRIIQSIAHRERFSDLKLQYDGADGRGPVHVLRIHDDGQIKVVMMNEQAYDQDAMRRFMAVWNAVVQVVRPPGGR